MTGIALREKLKIAGLAIAFVVLWNSGFIGTEYGLPYAATFTQLFWRYLILTGLLFLYLLATGTVLWPGRRVAWQAGWIGVLAHGVWLSCALLAQERGVPAGIVALIVALQPLATGAFSGLIAGEPNDARRWLGLLIGFAGVAIAVVLRMQDAPSDIALGYLIPFGAVIAITIASLVQRRDTLEGKSLPVPTMLFYQSLATMIALAGPAILLEGLVTEWTQPFVLTLTWLIIAVSLGAYGLMWMLLARIDATLVASLFYFGPPVTMGMAWIAFGDTLLVSDGIGLAVVLLGVLILSRKRKA